MAIATGTLLVLLTWAVLIVASISAGLLPALWLHGPGVVSLTRALRHAMWWGLGLSAACVLLVNLALPLGSPVTAAMGVIAVLGLGILGWGLLTRRSVATEARPRSRASIVLVVALALATIYIAAAALGPVTNYDSGLYHLGAISYARDFSTIPGLANLYSPLGYATVEFPWAAMLSNGPWSVDGYRLLNGLVIVMASVDLMLRLWSRRQGPGRPVLAVGMLAVLVPMTALVDYWVTSPTQDSSAFVLTIVASAYLAEMLGRRHAEPAEAGVIGALVITLVLIRPTMVAFALTALVVASVVLLRGAHGGARKLAGRVFVLVAGLGGVAFVANTARDYVLSGWLQYPLSVLAFDVPWRAAEPSMDRQATLGFHRDPERLWDSVEGWDWVSAWWASRWSQWETYAWLVLALIAVLLVVLALRTRVTLRWRRLALALLPSAVAVLFWWALTPPSYRFAWGPLFTLATVPIGWTLWRLANRSGNTGSTDIRPRVLAVTALVVAIPVLLVVTYSALVRMPWDQFTEERQWNVGLSVPFAVVPVIDVPVIDVPTTSGLTLTQPTQSDQCWTNYPLCTPRPYPGLRLQGEELQSGFLP